MHRLKVTDLVMGYPAPDILFLNSLPKYHKQTNSNNEVTKFGIAKWQWQ